MDSLLFLIKKHNNNKIAVYNDMSLHNLLTKTNKTKHGIHHMQYYTRIIKLQSLENTEE